jgi:hypothetical protein
MYVEIRKYCATKLDHFSNLPDLQLLVALPQHQTKQDLERLFVYHNIGCHHLATDLAQPCTRLCNSQQGGCKSSDAVEGAQ